MTIKDIIYEALHNPEITGEPEIGFDEVECTITLSDYIEEYGQSFYVKTLCGIYDKNINIDKLIDALNDANIAYVF